MKKVLFLMLFLMILGAASVKAQVRIGGNTAPNAAAVLDLNATDATNNGTKGLALPRVDLTSNTMQLTSGVVNLTGMLVYNTTVTLGRIGLYYWNGATWVLASLPSTSAADSGSLLMSNGKGVVWASGLGSYHQQVDSLHVRTTLLPQSWQLVLDTVWTTPLLRASDYVSLKVSGLGPQDFCYGPAYATYWFVYQASANFIMAREARNVAVPAGSVTGIRCVRPY